MANHQVQVKKTDSIGDELINLADAIRARAYELSLTNHHDLAGELDDWLRAERQLVWRPHVELREQDGRFELVAAVAGLQPADLDVQITPEDVLIKGASEQCHESKEGTVHVSEFECAHLFRSVHLPARIDPNSAKAECRDGLLRLTARMANAAALKEATVKAA